MADDTVLNSGDTAWMLTATALVLFMTIPGLALFYAGMVRVKNVLSVLMQCFAITALMTLLWFFYGYSIAFGGEGAFWGGFDKLFLRGVTVDAVSGTIPESVFLTFQMMLFNGHGILGMVQRLPYRPPGTHIRSRASMM